MPTLTTGAGFNDAAVLLTGITQQATTLDGFDPLLNAISQVIGRTIFYSNPPITKK